MEYGGETLHTEARKQHLFLHPVDLPDLETDQYETEED
jgi:hypothetical protein